VFIDADNEPLSFVFLASPGPGGGGGGGGLKQPAPPPKALREGPRKTSSPLPRREPPKPIVAEVAPPEPEPPPLAAEPLPALVAPIVAAPADRETRIGALEQTTAQDDSHGPGADGGVGTGAGTGIGEGDGPGVGPGSGGGIGGGPYRPGSGIEAPRLLREVKADYTDEARRANLEGEVLLEIVVKRDGTVGDPRVVRSLGRGLDQRAVQAVRQWRFDPARRHGTPVDVIVEVSVEFRLR
jgi:TonB family protein